MRCKGKQTGWPSKGVGGAAGGSPSLFSYRCTFGLPPGPTTVSVSGAANVFAELGTPLGLTRLDVSPNGAFVNSVQWQGTDVRVGLQLSQQLTIERNSGSTLASQEAVSGEIAAVVQVVLRLMDVGSVWTPQFLLTAGWPSVDTDAYEFLASTTQLLDRLNLEGFTRPGIGLRIVERDDQVGLTDLKIEPLFMDPTALYLELTVALPQVTVVDDVATEVDALTSRGYSVLESTAMALQRSRSQRGLHHG